MHPSTDSDISKWELLSSKYLYQHKYLTVRSDHVRLPNKSEIEDFFVIENPDWVNVVAITEDGLLVMERQYRHGLDIIEYEICAGMIDKGETPIKAAQRELLEETGYSGGQWIEYGKSSPNPSSMSNINHSFLAKGVRLTSKQRLEQTENIEVLLMSIDEVKQLMLQDEITEGIMLAPLWRYIAENELMSK